MNRIQLAVEDELSLLIPDASQAVASAGEPDISLDDVSSVFTPLHYERNYAYPLIVWLHGADGDENEVTRIMPLVSMRNYIGVGPRGTVRSTAAPGYRWSQGQDHIARAERRVRSAIAAARRWLNVDPARIYLAGYGAGGTMAFRVALNEPRAYAGVLSLGGAFPSTLRPLHKLHDARRLNVFLATGRDSQRYPEYLVCDNLRLFHSAGLSICLRQYPCGDDLTTRMLADMDRWIMDQITAPEPARTDQPSHRGRK